MEQTAYTSTADSHGQLSWNQSGTVINSWNYLPFFSQKLKFYLDSRCFKNHLPRLASDTLYIHSNLLPRVSHLATFWGHRGDPGWVWSCATLTIENIREGLSVIRQFAQLQTVGLSCTLTYLRLNKNHIALFLASFRRSTIQFISNKGKMQTTTSRFISLKLCALQSSAW